MNKTTPDKASARPLISSGKMRTIAITADSQRDRDEIQRIADEYDALNAVADEGIRLSNEAIHFRDAKRGKEFLNAAIDAHSKALTNLAAIRAGGDK